MNEHKIDYKELLNTIRHCRVCSEDISKAADVIDDLLAERETLLKAVHGNCCYCKHNGGFPDALGRSDKCICCVHDGDEQYRCMMMGKIFVSEGRMDNWEWSHKPTDRMPIPTPPVCSKEKEMIPHER